MRAVAADGDGRTGMTPAAPVARRVVIGGGITGLAAAHRLIELAPRDDVLLLEAAPRLGGVIRTEQQDGFLIEHGADSFITSVPGGIDLCQRIGFDDQLLVTDEAHRRAFVVCRGKLEPIPPGFLIMAPSRLGPMLTTPVLSAWGKIRLGLECMIPRRRAREDESLASFATRRFGREAYERLIQPLVGGIYTADPTRLSAAAAMPRFVEMERRDRSLILAAWREKKRERRTRTSADSGARYSMFVAPRDGMSSLIAAVADRLPPGAVRVGSVVESIARAADGRWQLSVGGETIAADAVILALPSHAAERLIAPLDASLANELSQIPYAGCAVVSLAYRREQIGHALDGFGFVVPLVEKRRILSASFSSVKFTGRAPQGSVLVRVFLGGACQEEVLQHADDEITEIAHEELAELLSIGGAPLLRTITRWNEAMPQYHVGHLERIERIGERVRSLPGLALAGNAFHGVGIPQCIRSGEKAAEEILKATSNGANAQPEG